ncbi:hypothetical protein QE152_g7096 [Popillia japonica]|uniref:Pedal peptide 2 n=1 Tax=Popillia japonica TaxID=7064 RepID=A0AAW1MEJ0_POPJA
MTEITRNVRPSFTDVVAGGSFRRPSDDTEMMESLRRPSIERLSDMTGMGSIRRPFTEAIFGFSFRRPSNEETAGSFRVPSSETVASGSFKRPSDMTEMIGRKL